MVFDPKTAALLSSDVTQAHAYGNGYDFRREAVETHGNQKTYHHEMLENWQHPHQNLFFETVTENTTTGDLSYSR